VQQREAAMRAEQQVRAHAVICAYCCTQAREQAMREQQVCCVLCRIAVACFVASFVNVSIVLVLCTNVCSCTRLITKYVTQQREAVMREQQVWAMCVCDSLS
jgi:hypothetical protein